MKWQSKCFYVHNALKTEGKCMLTQPRKTRFLSQIILIATLLSTVAVTVPTASIVSGQEATILSVNGLNGLQQNYTLTQFKALESVSMYGGYYQPNQNISNNGLWKGVSVFTLCNQVGGINPNTNITVTGQGNNTFTYTMINSGTNLNSQYKTYNNLTGVEQNQTQPATIILAYQVNGTNIASNQVPRLVMVGSEGLLMVAEGGRSVTRITITDITPAPTSTPTPTPSPTAQPTQAPTAIPTVAPTHAPTATPTPTSTPTAPPTPTATASPTPPGTASEEWPLTYTVLIIALIIGVVVGAVTILAKRK